MADRARWSAIGVGRAKSLGMLKIGSILPPLPRLKIVDVGAMSIGENLEPYAALMKALPCDVVGFEPAAVECEKLNGAGHEGRSYLPYFIGDGATHTFYECNAPMNSSLFAPNTPLLGKFQNLENLMRVVNSYPVETRRLDDIPQTAGLDYLKLDVQGGEMLVLNGAGERLKDALVVHTEVIFVPMYKDQPLFADIDADLRSRGLLLHRMNHAGRTFKPMVFKDDVNAMLSQWLWGDAVYVRDFMRFDRLEPMALLKLAAILHENYRSLDLAAMALEAYDRQAATRLQPQYIAALLAPSEA
jgi:FkbM family methyltransferase